MLSEIGGKLNGDLTASGDGDVGLSGLRPTCVSRARGAGWVIEGPSLAAGNNLGAPRLAARRLGDLGVKIGLPPAMVEVGDGTPCCRRSDDCAGDGR